MGTSYARPRMLLTDLGCHCPPRAVGTPRAFRTLAISQGRCAGLLSRPNDWKNVRCVSVGLSLHSFYRVFARYVELRVTQPDATGLCCREGLPGSSADQCALLLGESGKQVQHERVYVRSKLRDQERHLVRHEPADEMDIAAKAVQFRDGYWTPPFPCGCQSRL